MQLIEARMLAHRRLALVVAVSIGFGSSIAPTAADGVPRSSRPDPYVYSPAVALEYNWSGFYFGGHLGGALADWNWTSTNPAEPIDHKDFAFGGGAQIGLQKQWDWIVVGAEASYTWADLGITKPSAVTVGTSLTSEASNLLMVTGRLGFAWQSVLAYVKGGFASADIAFNTSNGVVTTASSRRENGSVAGLGLEYGLTPHITIGAEYDWLKLSMGGRTLVSTPPGVPASVVDPRVDIQTLMARLNFKFGPRTDAISYK